ncbi:hypothetical protein Syun_010536 [Stephania yunnanensis]|uniref:Uncharacterized protein n=1 Tax=Stephania yunnanensis TaxID=152371 RepID=A0AAP0PQ24_9MAGN
MKLCLGKSRVDFDLGKVDLSLNNENPPIIKPPSSPAGRFTQILSVGIGGSTLGPLKVCLQVYEYLHGVMSAFDPELSERHYKKYTHYSDLTRKGVVKPSCVLPLIEENVEKVLDEVRPSLMADGVVPYEAKQTIANMVKMWVKTRVDK